MTKYIKTGFSEALKSLDYDQKEIALNIEGIVKTLMHRGNESLGVLAHPSNYFSGVFLRCDASNVEESLLLQASKDAKEKCNIFGKIKARKDAAPIVDVEGVCYGNVRSKGYIRIEKDNQVE